MAPWRTLIWETSLPPSECRVRLQHYAEPDSLVRRFRFASRGTVYVSLRTNSFRLFVRGGTIIENAGRTLIRGQFRVHPFVVVFMGIWFAGVVFIGGSVTVVMLYEILRGRRSPDSGLAPGLGVVIAPAMLAFGVGLVLFGWRLGRSQRERIEQFLETTLQLRRLSR